MTIAAPLEKIKKYLNKEKVSFELIQHAVAYTASEIAGSRHIPGKQMIKSVLIKADHQFILCVIPAIHLIDFDKLQKVAKAKKLSLASEDEVAHMFPDYELGAEPPFGNLQNLKVYADRSLEDNEEIVFNAGTHTDLAKIKFEDFVRLANPVLADIGRHI